MPRLRAPTVTLRGARQPCTGAPRMSNGLGSTTSPRPRPSVTLADSHPRPDSRHPRCRRRPLTVQGSVVRFGSTPWSSVASVLQVAPRYCSAGLGCGSGSGMRRSSFAWTFYVHTDRLLFWLSLPWLAGFSIGTWLRVGAKRWFRT